MLLGKDSRSADLESAQLNAFTQITCRRFPFLPRTWQFRWRMQGCTSRSHEMSAARARFAGCETDSRGFDPTVPTEDYGLEMAARYISARESLRRFVRIFAIWPAATGNCAGGCKRKGTAAALYGGWRLESCAAPLRRSCSPSEMLKQMNQLVESEKLKGAS